MSDLAVYLGKPLLFPHHPPPHHEHYGCSRSCLAPFISSYHLKSSCIWISSGGYDMEERAARAYDLAALKYWGPSTHINFPVQTTADFTLFGFLNDI